VTHQLTDGLKEVLPAYMVPSVFVWLDSMPLTTSGKINRRALPAPLMTADDASSETLRDGTQEILAGIWSEVLGIERIGPTDHFFELGGHSLLATSVLSRIRTCFGREIPMHHLFEHPTLAGLAARIDEARRQAAAIDATIPRQARPWPVADPAAVETRVCDLPLSFAQERLWFLERLEQQQAVYNLPFGLELIGPFDYQAFRQAIETIARRHESLRTTFHQNGDEAVQRVAERVAIPVSMVDLSGLAQDRDEAVTGLIQAATTRPFRLEQRPPWRLLALRTGHDRHLLCLVMHHIISDGWSMGVLVRELKACYEATLTGGGHGLADPAVQYGDFAVWQRDWLTGEALARQLAYWKHTLNPAAAVLPLPHDAPRPAVQRFRGAVQRTRLDAASTAAVYGLARATDTTLFMVLSTAFNVLLYRYHCGDDIAMGFPVANRNQRQLEPLVGFFVNTLVLRTDLGGNPAFTTLLHRVRTRTLEAYDHQDLPFEVLVRELSPQRSMSVNPLVQVMIILQNAAAEAVSLAGLAVSQRNLQGAAAKFDMTLDIKESDGVLECVWEYDADLFEATTMVRLADHYGRLLQAACATPSRPIAELDMLSDAERHVLLHKLHAGEQGYGSDNSIFDLFSAQAEATPDAVALRHAADGGAMNVQITYQQLRARARHMAGGLRARGIGPETIVAVYLPRSFEMVAGLLAILRTGAAFLPLDAMMPRARLRYMLEDSGAALLLSDRRLLAELGDTGVPGATAAELSAAATPAGEDVGDANRIAYVIYTSGSTGRPKGVLATHRGAINRFHWMWRSYPFHGRDLCCQKTYLSFVDSIWEIFGPLLRGVPSVLIDEATAKDSARLVATLGRAGVTRLVLVPSLLSAMLDGIPDIARQLLKLRFWICSGETFPVSLGRRFFERFPTSTLLNLYGSSEVAADATAFRVTPAAAPVIPIGRPIDQVRCYILDRRGHLLPPGVVGEIHVGGAALARGYLKRPAWTAELFVPSPFGHGERLYRTGDLGRVSGRAELIYVGRHDQQVKLRGIRIELGEIETVLAAFPGVEEAVAAVRGDGSDQARLVAYVRVRHALDLDGLRGFAHEHLPDYMVPNAVVPLDVFPLTPNGKIDRDGLPAPELRRDQPTRLPRTSLERVIIDCFAEVLGAADLGIDDNFFELGGHSLLATRVLARLEQRLGLTLDLKTLFRAPTPAALARHCSSIEQGDPAKAIPRVPRTLSPDPQAFPLSYAQQRLWLLDKLERYNQTGSTLAYNMFFALELSGALDGAVLERALSAVVARHEALRTCFEERDEVPYQRIGAGARQPLSLVDLRYLTREDCSRATAALMQGAESRNFRLDRTPLMNVVLVRRAARRHTLLLTLHHIIFDGWSTSVFVREMLFHYHRLIGTGSGVLPELPIQYLDYAVWQRQQLAQRLPDQIDYWRRQLAGAPNTVLPGDHPRPRHFSSGGRIEEFSLPAALARCLRQVALQQETTLFTTLVTGFFILLHFHTGEDDLVIGSDMANRPTLELEDLIGFFGNQVVLRANLADEPSFATLLAEVDEMLMAAHRHQDVPFDNLVEKLQPPRKANATPFFQVKVVLQNMAIPELTLSGLDVKLLPRDEVVPKFDILLNVVDGPGPLRCIMEYREDLYEPETIARIVEQYQLILALTSENPEMELKALLGHLGDLHDKKEQVEMAEAQKMSRSLFSKTKRQSINFQTESTDSSADGPRGPRESIHVK